MDSRHRSRHDPLMHNVPCRPIVPMDTLASSGFTADRTIRPARTRFRASIDVVHVQSLRPQIERLRATQTEAIDQLVRARVRRAGNDACQSRRDSEVSFERHIETAKMSNAAEAHTSHGEWDPIVMGIHGRRADSTTILG